MNYQALGKLAGSVLVSSCRLSVHMLPEWALMKTIRKVRRKSGIARDGVTGSLHVICTAPLPFLIRTIDIFLVFYEVASQTVLRSMWQVSPSTSATRLLLSACSSIELCSLHGKKMGPVIFIPHPVMELSTMMACSYNKHTFQKQALQGKITLKYSWVQLGLIVRYLLY